METIESAIESTSAIFGDNRERGPYGFPEGPGWSSFGGRLWIKGHLCYWHDGTISDLSKGEAPCTYMPYTHDEDYSAWTDEKRASVLAENEKRRNELEMEIERRTKERDSLVESARKKLTEEEFEAVMSAGREQ